MSLNIKNERVHALAREAARITGKSQTSVIEEALVRLLRDYGADPAEARKVERTDDILRAAAAFRDELARPPGPPLRIEDLYDDETGLPR